MPRVGKKVLVHLKFASFAVLPMILLLFLFSSYWLRLTVEDLQATHDRDIAQTMAMFEDTLSILDSETTPIQLHKSLNQIAKVYAKKPGVSCVQLQTQKFEISYPPFAFCQNINFREKVEVSIGPESFYTFILNSKYLDEIVARAHRNTYLFVITSSIFLVLFTLLGIVFSYSSRFRDMLHLNQLMFEQNPIPTAHVDSDFRIISVSKSWNSTFEQAVTGHIRGFFDDDTLQKLFFEMRSLQVGKKYELEMEIPVKTYGSNIETFIAKIVVADADRTSFYVSLVNINAKLQKLDLREQQALRDNLTGCYTRTALLEKFAEGIYLINTEFVMIDIDDFKSVNDFYGHDIGDQFLRGFVQRAHEVFSDSHDLYRLGGEEFLFVEKEPNSPSDINHKIGILSSSEISTDQDVLLRSVSAGISSLQSNDGISAILSRCDQALMEAKNSGKNRIVQYSQLSDQVLIKFSDSDFQHAMEKDEFTYHFQPIFCNKRQQFAGIEGLIRWNSNESMLQPGQFYDAFSQFLTRTKQRSYQHKLFVRSLSEASIDDMSFVTYNVSKADFLEIGFNHLMTELTPLLSKIEVVLELSENMMFEGANNKHYPQMIEGLKAAGFKLALDDFGKDLSNLNRLIEIDVDLIKLDRSLIKNCAEDIKKLKILGCHASLFSELNIEVIAEGMETLSEAQALNNIGINLQQGYFYSRPVTASSVRQEYLLKIFEQNYERESNVRTSC